MFASWPHYLAIAAALGEEVNTVEGAVGAPSGLLGPAGAPFSQRLRPRRPVPVSSHACHQGELPCWKTPTRREPGQQTRTTRGCPEKFIKSSFLQMLMAAQLQDSKVVNHAQYTLSELAPRSAKCSIISSTFLLVA